jgi:hypothetical protein
LVINIRSSDFWSMPICDKEKKSIGGGHTNIGEVCMVDWHQVSVQYEHPAHQVAQGPVPVFWCEQLEGRLPLGALRG